MYTNSVRLEKCILVTYQKDEDASKPYALGGMLTFDVNSKTIESQWAQVFLSCNQKPPDSVVDEYKKYASAVKKWFNEHYKDNL